MTELVLDEEFQLGVEQQLAELRGVVANLQHELTETRLGAIVLVHLLAHHLDSQGVLDIGDLAGGIAAARVEPSLVATMPARMALELADAIRSTKQRMNERHA